MDGKKKILIVENFYPLQTRSLRIENSLKTLGHEVNSIMWNRNDIDIKESKGHFVFTKAARNKIKKLFSILSYYYYLKEIVRVNKYDIVIAVHWDMLFLCAFLKNKNKLVYDNLDMPTHKFYLLRKLFRLIEVIALQQTDAIIYASRFFKQFYNNKRKTIIFENKPLKVITKGFEEKKINEVLNISFLGTLRYVESLKLLMDAIGNLSGYNLTIKGSGFSQELIEYSQLKNYSNVSLDIGWYNYDNLGMLFSKVDLVWAAYPCRDFNVKYAISNKFFESLVFNKPGVYSKNTELGNLVEREGLGFVVDPYSKTNIKLLLKKIKEEKLINIIKKNQNIYLEDKSLFWENDEHEFNSLIDKLYSF